MDLGARSAAAADLTDEDAGSPEVMGAPEEHHHEEVLGAKMPEKIAPGLKTRRRTENPPLAVLSPSLCRARRGLTQSWESAAEASHGALSPQADSLSIVKHAFSTSFVATIVTDPLFVMNPSH